MDKIYFSLHSINLEQVIYYLITERLFYLNNYSTETNYSYNSDNYS